jgi:hypothetical protein
MISNHLIYPVGAGKGKKKSFKNEGMSPEVIENTCREMRSFRYPVMLMKTSSLCSQARDVDENKRS